MSDRDDVKLLKQIQQGNLPGLIGLYERFGPLVYTLSLRILASSEHAGVLTRDLFLEIWETAAARTPGRGDVFTWIVDRCRRKALELRRSKAFRLQTREQEAEDSSQAKEAPEESAGEAQFSDRRGHLAEALKSVSKDNLKILKLAYFKGYAPQQIGRMLRMSPGAVRARLNESVDVLRGSAAKGARRRQDHPQLGQCVPYAMGELMGARQEEFERHLADGCSTCGPELESIVTGIHLLPLTLVPRIPPPALRDELTAKLVSSARSTRTATLAGKGGLRPWMFMVVLGLLVAVMGVSAYVIETLISGMDDLKTKLEQVSLESAEARRALSVTQRPGLQSALLQGRGVYAAARGTTSWDPQSGDLVLIAKGLPPSTEGRTYRAWLLAGGKEVRMGEFGIPASEEGIELVRVFRASISQLGPLEEIRVTVGAIGATTASLDTTCLSSRNP